MNGTHLDDFSSGGPLGSFSSFFPSVVRTPLTTWVHSNNQLPECGEYDLPTLLSVPELFINCADIEIEGFEATANGGTGNTTISSTENGNSTTSSTANGSSSASSKSMPFFLLDSKRSVVMMWMMTILFVSVPLVSGASW